LLKLWNKLPLSYHLPVIQNVNAEIATDVAQLRQALTAQLYQSVQWTRTMQYLQDQGAVCG
jgi:[acyl-carrier-protein] S-malonyltransferase